MENTYSRLIFDGLRQSAQPDAIIQAFKQSLGFSETSIRAAFTSPPRVLTLSEDKEHLSQVRQQIEEAGGRLRIEAMANDSTCPFPLPRTIYKRIIHELDKGLKGEFTIGVINLKLTPNSDEIIIPSALEGICEKIEAMVEPCVAVLPVDDNRLIILDFFSDHTRIQSLIRSLEGLFWEMFGDSVHVIRGFAFFPESGKGIGELLQAAAKNARPAEPPDREGHEDLEGRLSLETLIKDGESASEMLQQALVGARGKKFKWIEQQPLDLLWLGLGLMPKVRQQEFLFRLPLSSPLAAELEQALQNRKKQPIGSEDDQRRTEELLIKISGFDHEERFAHLKHEIPEKLKDIDALPTLSKVALAIVEIARKPDSHIQELTSVIQNDPALTLAILKIVNSAFYGFPQKIETIERAVVILGREEVVNLALGLGASQALDEASAHGLYQPQVLWHHLMGTALICRFLYKTYRKKDDPVLFTAGLLHDFGKIFLVRHYSDVYDKIHLDAVEYGIPLYELEEECFGINHAMIGKHIGSNWNLPEPLIQAAAFHHQPFFATEHASLAAIIGFADYLYHRTGLADDVSDISAPCPPYLTYGHWQIIREECPGIVFEDIEGLVSESKAFIEENSQVFAILK